MKAKYDKEIQENQQSLKYDEILIHKDELGVGMDQAQKVNHRKLKVQLMKENQTMKEIYNQNLTNRKV